MSAAATWMMNREMAKLDFPPVDEFMEMLVDAGAHIYACKQSMDMLKLKLEDFVDGSRILGVMEFLEIAEGAQIIFV